MNLKWLFVGFITLGFSHAFAEQEPNWDCLPRSFKCPEETVLKRSDVSCWTCVFALHPYYPFLNKDGSVSLSPGGIEGDPRVYDCQVINTKTQYIGNQAVCSEKAKCMKSVPSSQTNIFEVTISPICITTEKDGCSKKSWQSCLRDNSFPEDYDFKKCVTDNKVQLISGCQLPTDTSTSSNSPGASK